MENKIETSGKNTPRKKRMPFLVLAGIAIGGLGGYLYYHFVGCQSGSCAITSNPWLSVLWGGAIGYLVFDMIPRKRKPAKEDDGSVN